MTDNKFDFSVADIQIEGQSVENSNTGCFIALNGTDLDCIIVDDTDHRLVLDLADTKGVLRVLVKGLVGDQLIGSISFLASTFHTNAVKKTKECWVTLFDHQDDDLYDGDFAENDSELPRIKISFTRGTTATIKKAGATKKKIQKTTTVTAAPATSTSTTVTTHTYTESTTNVTHEDSTRYSIETLRAELQSKLEELIDTLKTEYDDIHAENNERVATLANLETVHEELKGEHDQDIAFGKVLDALKVQISSDLGIKRVEIEQRKTDLLAIIKELEDATRHSEGEKSEAQKEKNKLTGIVETPEDLTEKGFTDQAKTLRNGNEKYRSQSDNLTVEFLSARDQRNKIIQSHSELVEKYEGTVQHFHDELRKTASSKKAFAYERDSLLKESNFVALEGDFFQRRTELGEFDAKSLQEALDRLTKEYADSDNEFNRYTEQIRSGFRNQDFLVNDLVKKFAARQNQLSDLHNQNERQLIRLNHFKNELEKIEQIGYETKYATLSSDLSKAEQERRKHQDELEKAQEGLTIKLSTFADDLEGRRRERDEQAQKVDQALQGLQTVQNTINDLLKELETLQNKGLTDTNRDRVNGGLSAEREAIENKLQFATDEKNKIHKELQEAIDTMNEKHRRVEEQKQTIARLVKDISDLKNLIEEKKRIIEQLETDIQLAEEEIERLKGIVDDLYRKIADRDAEIEKLRRLIDEHDARIAQLEAEIGTGPPIDITYRAQKGDLIDEMLAQYIQNCPVPVKRLGGGFYLFGTRKIYAKIMNGKLVIRVGGGYMVIEQFIDTYAESELLKINAILEKEGLTHVDQIDLEDYCLNRNRNIGNNKGESSPGGKNNSSMRGKTFTSSTKGGINGTLKTSKTFKASQVVSHTET
jgi:chromosome segregation ATPase